MLVYDSKVSIHASVKDATFNRCCLAVYIDVSIHASVKDATARNVYRTVITMFQSTRP